MKERDLCQVPGCDFPRNHSQLHNVVEALHEACDLVESIGYTTSKAAIDRAAKQLIASGAAKVAKAVVARVRELGGAQSTATYPIGEYAADKNEPAPALDTEEVNRLLAAAGE